MMIYIVVVETTTPVEITATDAEIQCVVAAMELEEVTASDSPAPAARICAEDRAGS